MNHCLQREEQVSYNVNERFIFRKVSVTFAQRLRVVPVWIPGTDALDDGGTLLQRVAWVAGKLDHSSDAIQRVRSGEVSILKVWLVAVAAFKRWEGPTQISPLTKTKSEICCIGFCDFPYDTSS